MYICTKASRRRRSSIAVMGKLSTQITSPNFEEFIASSPPAHLASRKVPNRADHQEPQTPSHRPDSAGNRGHHGGGGEWLHAAGMKHSGVGSAAPHATFACCLDVAWQPSHTFDAMQIQNNNLAYNSVRADVQVSTSTCTVQDHFRVSRNHEPVNLQTSRQRTGATCLTNL